MGAEAVRIQVDSSVITLKKGDITEESVDAIVNAANSRLAGGGGVDGAIHRAGGPDIMAECRKIGACHTGRAVATTAGALRAKYVIHTVGPIYKDGAHRERELLSSAYTESLKLATEKGARTIAFPSISTGAYGYPVDEASMVALSAVIKFLKENKGITEARFILFSERDLEAYSRALKKLL